MVHTKENSEEIIKELKSLVVEANYEEPNKSTETKVDKNTIWEKAKKVSKNLSDDTLPSPTTSRT